MQKFTIGKHTFEVPELREGDELHATGPNAARAVVDALQDALAEIGRVTNDPHLSPAGKDAKARPLREGIILGIAAIARMAKDDATEADRRDAELTQVPQLHPAAAAVAAEDGEARAWWRNLPVDERSKIMQALQDDPTAAQKYERLQLALLRSPVPLPDLEVKHIGELWKQTQRLDNPAEALAIDSLHRAHDWSERVLGHAAGIASGSVGLSRAEILDTLVAAGGPALEGAGVFGFDAATIAHGVRVAEARKAAQAVSKA